MTTDNRTNEPSEQQVERAAEAMQAESSGFFSMEAWRHLARVALTAAGVAAKSGKPAPSPDREKLIAEYVNPRMPGRQNSDGHLMAQAFRAGWDAALAAPLDPEKVAEVLLANAKSRYGGLLFEERAAARIANALCEAYTEGKLT